MGVARRELLRAAGAMVAALPLAATSEAGLGPAGRLAWAAALPPLAQGEPPDVVVLNARIHTLDSQNRTVEALAIKNGRVQAVGDTATIRAMAGPDTVRHNLAGLTIVPGFYDSHNHMRQTGLNFFAVDLSEARGVADVLQAIARRAAIAPAGEWVVASSRWHEGGLAEQRFPLRTELDTVAPNHPVYIPRGGHNVVLNSLAFARAGIDATTVNPPGGTYVRDAAGALTGHIVGEPAWRPVNHLLPRPNAERQLEGLRAAVRAYHAAGITSVIEPGLEPSDLATYQSLWQNGELTVRTTAMPRVTPGFTEQELNRALDTIRGFAFSTGFGDQWLRLGAIKVSADGGVEASYLREPFAYADDPEEVRGKPRVTVENLIATGVLARQLGWQMGVHCVGDAGIDLVLDAYEAVHAQYPLTGQRWQLIHMMLARPEHFDRARALDLVITAQQPLTYALSAGWVKYWGRERASDNEPLRAYLESGLPVGNGTDSPVTPFAPLLNLWSSATRETQYEGVLGERWAITVPDALRWYTRGSAHVAFEEQVKGSLEVGKLADLVALSVDPLTAEPVAVRDARVLLTMVGGQIVHDGAPPSSLLPQRPAHGLVPGEGCHCAEAHG